MSQSEPLQTNSQQSTVEQAIGQIREIEKAKKEALQNKRETEKAIEELKENIRQAAEVSANTDVVEGVRKMQKALTKAENKVNDFQQKENKLEKQAKQIEESVEGMLKMVGPSNSGARSSEQQTNRRKLASAL